MAETRETQVLEDVVESTEIENPRTTEEAILAKIIAGEEVNIDARTRYQAYLKELSSISGGNPNFVETITGTVANPWGEKNPADLFSEAKSNNCTLYMAVDGTALGAGQFTVVFYPFAESATVYSFEVVGLTGENVSDWFAGSIGYYENGTLASMVMLTNGNVVNVSSYASMMNTVLSIVHHPLPEDNS